MRTGSRVELTLIFQEWEQKLRLLDVGDGVQQSLQLEGHMARRRCWWGERDERSERRRIERRKGRERPLVGGGDGSDGSGKRSSDRDNNRSTSSDSKAIRASQGDRGLSRRDPNVTRAPTRQRVPNDPAVVAGTTVGQVGMLVSIVP